MWMLIFCFVQKANMGLESRMESADKPCPDIMYIQPEDPSFKAFLCGFRSVSSDLWFLSLAMVAGAQVLWSLSERAFP
jgi:hypothetical protein